MTPVEKLEAAIAKLEGLVSDVRAQQSDQAFPTYFIAPKAEAAAPQLSMTLHRTINAQIVILKDFLRDIRPYKWLAGDAEHEPVMRLADAIIGGEQS